jgi:photosystem II stability/assembly factor-like uncharacterized protein
MKLHLALPLVGLFLACSSTSSHDTPSDAGSQTDATSPLDAAPGDARTSDVSSDAPDPYEEAVMAARWQAVSGAPTAPTMAKMDDIYLPSALVGYAVSGAASTIYKTVDGGATWTTSYTHAGTYFRSLDFIDDNHGFASNLGAGLASSITDTNVLYETKDAGTTWTPVTAITGPMPSGICNQTQIDAQHLVAVGRVEGPAYFMKSSDGGASWTSQDMSSEFTMLIDARFTSPTDGILIGSGPGNISTGSPAFHCSIEHTSDGGSTWQNVFTSKTANTLCWKISFPSAQVGYVSVQDAGQSGPPSFLKTTDGGQTWTEKPLPKNPSGYYLGIGMGFITENIGWVSADYDGTSPSPEPTYRTIDGGETWTIDATLKSPINRFRFLDPTTAFAIGGTVWKLSVPATGGDM